MVAPVSALTLAGCAIGGLLAVIGVIRGLDWWLRRQLDPPEFTGDQGFDAEGCP